MMMISSVGGIIYFFTYEYSKKKAGTFYAAGIGEMAIMSIMYPLELLKLKMQVSMTPSTLKKSMHSISQSTGGFLRNLKKFYVGFFPNLGAHFSFIITQYGMYNGLRKQMRKNKYLANHEGLSVLLCSLISGAFSSSITNQLESHTVMKQLNTDSHTSMGWIQNFKKGLAPRVCYYSMMSIIEFTLIEHIYHMYNAKFI